MEIMCNTYFMRNLGFLGYSYSKEPTCNTRDPDSLGQEDPLEKGMATYSSIIA